MITDYVSSLEEDFKIIHFKITVLILSQDVYEVFFNILSQLLFNSLLLK